MNNLEYLFACLSEEAGEVSQIVGKILRFGIEDIDPHSGISNLNLLNGEINDLIAVALMLKKEGIELKLPDEAHIVRKICKVSKYIEYSRSKGLLK